MVARREKVGRLANLLSSFVRRGGEERENGEPETRLCLSCQTDLSDSQDFQHYRVCHNCGFHYNMPARERIDILTDQGTFKELNRSLISLDPLSFSGGVPYRKKLFEAQRMTGLTEAVVTGLCEIKGSPAVIVVLDFGFLGGSMGCVVGEKVTLAFETAIKKKLPLVAVVTSGGARIQEGVLSLMQMAKTTAAAKRLHEAGLPFISVLANPATGQVYASFANMADIILAEPGALVGFAPLRTVEQATISPLPKGAHTAESHLEHGMIDRVVPRARLTDLLTLLLDLLSPQYKLTLRKKRKQTVPANGGPESAWDRVMLSRHEDRPTSLDYIGRIISGFIELHGDRVQSDDPAVIYGLGYIRGQAVVVVGQERGHDDEVAQRNEGRTGPEGFRKAQRAMQMAARFKLPLVTFVDTPGALPSLEAEERGLGHTIASTMALLSDLPTPVVSVIIGEGGSEGALALSVADRILMLENAIYSPISPEGAATLLYRDPTKAEEVAPALKLTARDCKKLGIIDVVIPEPPGGAHLHPDQAARQVQRLLVRELLEI
ncbi:MAG: acetyl-CoA carboxylase carboxyltransferase subunit alpha/beta, partial [Dehalococcoidia bacterium]